MLLCRTVNGLLHPSRYTAARTPGGVSLSGEPLIPYCASICSTDVVGALRAASGGMTDAVPGTSFSGQGDRMRCRGSFSLTNRSCVVVWTLLLAALACRDDTSSPTGPEPSPRLTASAATLSFQQVSAGGFHACGVTSAGQAYCWGDNDFGALGTGSNTGPEACSGAVGPFPCSTRPVLVVGGTSFTR